MSFVLLFVIFILLFALCAFLWGEMFLHGRRVINKPVDCESKCGKEVCNAYKNRVHGFSECMRCQNAGMCWSAPQKECVPCQGEQHDCASQEQYGCQNPYGFMLPDVLPINPAINECQKCW